MTKTVEHILEHVKALDEADQADLIDHLSLLNPGTDPQHDAAWEAEIRRRIEQVERGEVASIPWREAIEQIRRDEGDEQ